MHGVLLLPSLKKQRELIQGPNAKRQLKNHVLEQILILTRLDYWTLFTTCSFESHFF